MLTKGFHQDEADSTSGVISLGSTTEGAFDGVKGALILAGEEEEEEEDSKQDDEDSLSLPESVLLPSEIINCLSEKNLPVAADAEQGDEKVDEAVVHLPNNTLKDCSSIRQSTLFALVAVLFFITSMVSWAYNKSQSEVRRLKKEIKSQQAILPLTLLLAQERQTLTTKISMLKDQIKCSGASSCYDNIFPGGGLDKDTYVVFENCYFTAALTTGACYKDWQAWINDNIFDQYGSTSKDDVEESFALKLLNSIRTKSSQSYSHVETGFKNITFRGYASALLNGMYMSQHFDNGISVEFYDSVTNDLTKAAQNAERRVYNSLSSALDYSSSFLKKLMEQASDKDIIW